MALSDEVKGRYPSNLLIELTNQGDTTAITINDTVLGYAAADAEGEFKVETGLTFDATKAAHVACCTAGTLFYLYSYSGIETSTAQKERQRFERFLAKIDATTGAGKRIHPTTTSTLSPTAERAGSKPDMERSRFSQMTPRMPRLVENDDVFDEIIYE
jgi:hypothetical protein